MASGFEYPKRSRLVRFTRACGVNTLSFLAQAKLFQPGTSEENPFGYTGQFAIRELLTMTPDMTKLLTRPAHELSTEVIEEVAVKNGMLTMKQDGVLRALQGDTTYEEISRVLG